MPRIRRRWAWSAVPLAAALALPAAAATTGPTAPTGPRAAVTSAGRQLMFVPSFSSNVVSVVDVATGRIVKYLGLQAKGACCAYLSPDSRTVYIVDGLSAFVTEIDVRSLSVTHVIPIQGTYGDHGSAMPSDGKTLWLDDLPQGDIEGIDTATHTQTVFFKGVGGLFANSLDGRHLYVDSSSTFEVLDSATGTVVGRAALPHSSSIAVFAGPDRRTAYVIGSTTSSAPLVGSVSSSFVDIVDVSVPTRPVYTTSVPIGSFPLIPTITPDNRQMWVPNAGDGTIAVIDLRTARLVRTIQTGRYITYVGFAGGHAYVAQSPDRVPPTYATSVYQAIAAVIPGAATAPESGQDSYRPGIDIAGELAQYDVHTYAPTGAAPITLPSETFVTTTVTVPGARR